MERWQAGLCLFVLAVQVLAVCAGPQTPTVSKSDGAAFPRARLEPIIVVFHLCTGFNLPAAGLRKLTRLTSSPSRSVAVPLKNGYSMSIS